MIKLVLSDMDNTLLPYGESRVSNNTLKAIANLQKTGIAFGPATGRDAYELHRFFAGHDSCFDTGILGNGKIVRAHGKTCREVLMDIPALERLARELREVEGVYLGLFPLDRTQGQPILCLDMTQEQVEYWGKRCNFVGVPATRVPNISILGATLLSEGGQEALDKGMELGRSICPEFDFVQPVPLLCDVIPHGVSKGSALPYLLEELQIAQEEVVFFGDAANDLEIMHRVDNTVAVANATPEVAALARWHIGASAEEAVAQALADIARAHQKGTLPRFMSDQNALANDSLSSAPLSGGSSAQSLSDEASEPASEPAPVAV